MQALQANPEEVKRIFAFGLPYENHHAGGLWFGPTDKYLYYPLGDGGSYDDPWNNGQNINIPLGKMMRLDIDTPPSKLEWILKPCVSLDNRHFCYFGCLVVNNNWAINVLLAQVVQRVCMGTTPSRRTTHLLEGTTREERFGPTDCEILGAAALTGIVRHTFIALMLARSSLSPYFLSLSFFRSSICAECPSPIQKALKSE